MKRIVVGLLSIVMLSTTGCKKKNPLDPLGVVGCAANYEKLATALNNFSTNPTEATCRAYKNEIVAFVKSCPTYYSEVDRKELEDFAKEPCDIQEN